MYGPGPPTHGFDNNAIDTLFGNNYNVTPPRSFTPFCAPADDTAPTTAHGRLLSPLPPNWPCVKGYLGYL
jgi:hypothetical protein